MKDFTHLTHLIDLTEAATVLRMESRHERRKPKYLKHLHSIKYKQSLAPKAVLRWLNKLKIRDIEVNHETKCVTIFLKYP